MGSVFMAAEWAIGFYKSAKWRRVREGYIMSVHGICERCGESGLIVHHKILLTPQNINNPEVSLNWEHLELLCQECHNDEHHGTQRTADGLRFDENGELYQVKII